MLAPSQTSDEISPELMRYLDRDYWEKKEQEKADFNAEALSDNNLSSLGAPNISDGSSKTVSATEPTKTEGVPSRITATTQHQVTQQTLTPVLAGGASNEELGEFVTTTKTQVEIFVNRMKSNSSRGRSIINDSSVQTLFMNTIAMHSKVLKHYKQNP